MWTVKNGRNVRKEWNCRNAKLEAFSHPTGLNFSIWTRTSAFHVVWLDKLKEPIFYLGFRTKYNFFFLKGASPTQLTQVKGK